MGLLMDQAVPKCYSCDVDLESGEAFLGGKVSNEPVAGGFDETGHLLSNACDGSVQCEAKVTVSIAPKYSVVSLENLKPMIDKKTMAGEKKAGVLEKKEVKEKQTMSAKKPPKPPRSSRGLSMDSADQQLIRELAEIAKLKRERIERMKALMNMKEAKTSSSKNQLYATLITILFCLVILFQGISSRTNSSATLQVSPMTSGAKGVGTISMVDLKNLSGNDAKWPGSFVQLGETSLCFRHPGKIWNSCGLK